MAAPRKLTGKAREAAAKLVEENGAMGAARILAARNGSVGLTKVERDLASMRRAVGVEKPVKVTHVTMANIAKEFGIALNRGRRTADKTVATA